MNKQQLFEILKNQAIQLRKTLKEASPGFFSEAKGNFGETLCGILENVIATAKIQNIEVTEEEIFSEFAKYYVINSE